jgi:type I restriction enzyme S subunit
VEFKTLGEVCGVQRGKRLTKSELSDDEKYPVFHGGIEPLGYYKEANREAETVMVINVGASAGTVGYSKEPFWSSDGCFCLRHSDTVIARFIYYYLQTREKEIKSRVRYAGIPTLDGFVVEQFPIPLPPLEIQEKIVECLDKFSALAAELQAELQMRRKQYEYYRTQLLTPHSDSNSADNTDVRNWEWKYLVDVATVQYGYPFEAEKFTDDESFIPLIRIRDIIPAQASTYYEGTYPPEYIVKKGDILVGMDGNFNLEKWNDRDGLLNQRVCKIFSNDDNIILNDYLYHYLRPEFKKIENEIKGGTVKHLSAARIKQIMVPVPSIKEQCKIADALNLFSKIIQDMENGIPAEQAAQQKRYEYYRDLLLTFPRKEA